MFKQMQFLETQYTRINVIDRQNIPSSQTHWHIKCIKGARDKRNFRQHSRRPPKKHTPTTCSRCRIPAGWCLVRTRFRTNWQSTVQCSAVAVAAGCYPRYASTAPYSRRRRRRCSCICWRTQLNAGGIGAYRNTHTHKHPQRTRKRELGREWE